MDDCRQLVLVARLQPTGWRNLVRVILEGRRYFAEKFGVRPRVAYNFDTFGHPSSLPQLLQGSDRRGEQWTIRF